MYLIVFLIIREFYFFGDENRLGFKKEDAESMLPQVKGICNRLYNSGRKRKLDIKIDGYIFQVEVNSSAEVRPIQGYRQSYGAHQPV